MKRCYYMCVRLCGVYVRGVLFPKITFQIYKELFPKISLFISFLSLVVCAK